MLIGLNWSLSRHKVSFNLQYLTNIFIRDLFCLHFFCSEQTLNILSRVFKLPLSEL